MKKVLFAFAAVLALASCQKAAEKASEAPADSTKTEAVQATETAAPEATGDAVADVKARLNYIKEKIQACKTVDELAAFEKDPVLNGFEDFMNEVGKKATPEQMKEVEEWMQQPGNNLEEIIKAKVEELAK